jgi:hypothetical protein
MMKKLCTFGAGVLSLVVLLGYAPSSFATSTITGHWVITQAAQQSHGSSPQIVACGDLTITVLQSLSVGQRGVFTGIISFTTIYVNPEAKSVVVPLSEQITGEWMIPGNGALFVSFKGESPVLMYGSFISPAVQPHPSIDPTKVGCAALSDGFLGLIHLPSQGTEGMTIYSETSVSPSVFS